MTDPLKDAWLAGFHYGTGLYSSSRLPCAEEDGWARYSAEWRSQPVQASVEKRAAKPTDDGA